MDKLEESYAIVKAVLVAMPNIVRSLGPDWPEFRQQILFALKEIQEADEDEVFIYVDELLDLGLESAAAAIFRKILRQIQKDSGLVDAARSGKLIWFDDLQTLSSTQESTLPKMTMSEFHQGMNHAIKNLADMPEQPEEYIPYLITDFFEKEKVKVKPEQPLNLDHGPYHLQIHIGPRYTPTPWEDEPFPVDLLQEELKEKELLQLGVRVTSANVEIQSQNEQDILYFASDYTSTITNFVVTPRQTGRITIDVDVFFRGNLLQRQRIQVMVVAQKGDMLPASALPSQSRKTIYTITGELSKEALARWEERLLHIVVQKQTEGPNAGTYEFCFRQGEQDIFSHDGRLVDTSLSSLIPAVRAEMTKVAEAFRKMPKGEEAKDLLVRWLPQLAYQGAKLYEGILSTESSPLIELPYGSVVQVSPIGPHATLPWHVIYDRKILTEFKEDSATGKMYLVNPLCPDWLSGHDCNEKGCPNSKDINIICPSGFWGYRYIVEQIPAGIGNIAEQKLFELPAIIDNCNETRFNFNHYAFARVKDEIDTYQQTQEKHKQFNLEIVPDKGSFATFISQSIKERVEPHILYFYAHGGKNEGVGSYIRLGKKGSGDLITLSDLTAIGIRDNAFSTHPLVFLNACETADYGPDDYSSFIERFYQAGACGLIGTECTIWEPIAQATAKSFFQYLFQQKPAGEAMWLTTHKWLRENNPVGLFYSLFAISQTRLLCPVAA